MCRRILTYLLLGLALLSVGQPNNLQDVEENHDDVHVNVECRYDVLVGVDGVALAAHDKLNVIQQVDGEDKHSERGDDKAGGAVAGRAAENVDEEGDEDGKEQREGEPHDDAAAHGEVDAGHHCKDDDAEHHAAGDAERHAHLRRAVEHGVARHKHGHDDSEQHEQDHVGGPLLADLAATDDDEHECDHEAVGRPQHPRVALNVGSHLRHHHEHQRDGGGDEQLHQHDAEHFGGKPLSHFLVGKRSGCRSDLVLLIVKRLCPGWHWRYWRRRALVAVS
mmetsp:Transcript_29375/g.73714  ORF Transcript_29375/g.73714 Transcript_29375/m.73714 type:complete len:278 (-) Transcript_29375:245-1078(-)